jgi:hypothetical protein
MAALTKEHASKNACVLSVALAAAALAPPDGPDELRLLLSPSASVSVCMSCCFCWFMPLHT